MGPKPHGIDEVLTPDAGEMQRGEAVWTGGQRRGGVAMGPGHPEPPAAGRGRKGPRSFRGLEFRVLAARTVRDQLLWLLAPVCASLSWKLMQGRARACLAGASVTPSPSGSPVTVSVSQALSQTQSAHKRKG